MGTRRPGPIGSEQEQRSLDDGTLARTLSPLPGPIGAGSTGASTTPRKLPPRARRKSASETELPILRRGAQGAEVEKLQRLLNVRLIPAPKLAVDGVFGPITQRAVIDYQSALAIDADGVVGKLTWYHLVKGDKATVRSPAPAAAHAHAGGPELRPAPAAPAPPPATAPGVWEWPLEEKFADALRRTAPKLDDSIRDEFKALLTPASLAMMAGTLVVWAASHAFGVGAVVDVLLLIAGVAFLGMAAFDVAEDLGDFVMLTSTASSEDELERASTHLSHALAVIGVAAFMALLAKVAARARTSKAGQPKEPLQRGQHKGDRSAQKQEPKRGGEPEPTPKRITKKLSQEELATWYKKQGFDNPEILEKHLKGTDLKQPILLTELEQETKVIQYVRVDGKPGMYFARPGTPMESLGISPPPERVLKTFVVKKPIEVVQSTAATIEPGLAPGVGGMGGGQQLIFPKGWENSVVPL